MTNPPSIRALHLPSRWLLGGLCLLVLVLLILPLFANAEDISARDAAIIETVINHGLGAEPGLLVIGATTTGDPAAIAEHEAAAAGVVADLGAPEGTLQDWIHRNRERVEIARPLDIAASYQMLDDTRREAIFGVDDPHIGWAQFGEQYPGTPGIIRVSRAGYDDALEHALLYVEHQCGVECGSGRLVLVKLGANAGWQVASSALVWMAE